MKLAAAALAGIVFGFGLMVSGMAEPDNVLAFLTAAPGWDPALLGVMGSALIVTALVYALARRRTAPLFDAEFQLPTRRSLDARLLAGASVFGIGWGLAGYCPGPAVVGLFVLDLRAALFMAAFLAGSGVYQLVNRALEAGASSTVASAAGDG